MAVSASGQSSELLIEVVGVLNARGIDYVVIGAMAVSLHGVVRASVDADAIVSATSGQMKALSKELAASGLTTEFRMGEEFDAIPAMLIVSDRHENRVDLLMGLRQLDSEVYSRAKEIIVPELGAPLRFASREDLIAMKLFAGSPKDLMDVERMIAVGGSLVDFDLVQRLAARFGRNAVENYKKIVERS